MSPTVSQLYVPIVAPPVRPPQLTLIGQSLEVPDDGFSYDLPAGQLDSLPDDLKAELRLRTGEEWTRGFAYEPENGSGAVNRGAGDVTTVDNVFLPANEKVVEFQPFAVITKFTCSPFGWQALDYQGRAVRQNDAAIYQAVEHEFWTGAIATASGYPNNFLTNITNVAQNLTPGATTISNGVAVSITTGLGILQEALAQTGLGGQGMIHLILRAAPSLINVRRVGKFMLDEFDNIIVPGVGYPGTGPGGAVPSAGTTWLYATDVVMTKYEREARVYPDTFAEAMDWGQNSNPNTVTFRAERLAAACFDGFRQFAVLVNLPTT